MILYIKYMVSVRCEMLVRAEVKKMGLNLRYIDLGMIDIVETISGNQLYEFSKNLRKSGLELLDNKKRILIERINSVIIKMVHHADELPQKKYSEYISEKLGLDYTYLSNLFSDVKGVSIQQIIIIHRIERVKELLLYDELSLTDIAYKMNYSSLGHLSNQFKKSTGLSPKFYKQVRKKRNEILENR